MKTCLFSPCYLDGVDPSKTPRLDRVIRHAQYYRGIQKYLEFEEVYLSDDGSSFENLAILERAAPHAKIFRHDKLPRPAGVLDCNYPWCWQALWDTKKLIELGHEKIIHIDTDTFVLSRRLADYIKMLDSGWTALKVHKYGFASAEMHILCADSFHIFQTFASGDFRHMNGQKMEEVTPYNRIIESFIGDRFGEDRLHQKPEWDWASQVPGDIPMTFNPIICDES